MNQSCVWEVNEVCLAIIVGTVRIPIKPNRVCGVSANDTIRFILSTVGSHPLNQQKDTLGLLLFSLWTCHSMVTLLYQKQAYCVFGNKKYMLSPISFVAHLTEQARRCAQKKNTAQR